ncbi:13E12 repeat family protein, partial [Mycolicibacterium sp. PAM1]
MGGDLQTRIAGLRAAFDEVAACEIELLTRPDLVAALDELEELSCQLPAVGHRLLARLQAEGTPQQLGAKSWSEVLRVRWRISGSEAHRRLTEAGLLAPRPSLTGPALPPQLAATAIAQARGLINAEHVAVIRKAVKKLPGWVDVATRE